MSKKVKKLLAVLLSIVLVLAVIIIPQVASKTISSNLSVAKMVGKAPKFAAHRGLSALCPQNTVPAFQSAADEGFYAFEFDIHTTSDGKWVVIHNDTVDDMTDGTGDVSSFTLDEIKQLNIDNGNGIEDYSELKIPTLEEALSVCDGSDIIPIIEIKSCDTKYFPELLISLEQHGLIEKAVIISFELDYLKELRELSPDIEMMYLVGKPTKEAVDMCIENGIDGLDFYGLNVIPGAKAVKYAKEKGLKLAAWTIDNTVLADILTAAGVELITTNRILP
ncbi:MAG: hypothetical protein J1F23_00640 [Oscillospiraceae bacterium]|nr:hypothetical protein [Oscillospiraceae bacterium]